MTGRSRYCGGLRLRSFVTRQDMSAAGLAISPSVRLTTYELVGRANVAEWAATRVQVSASVGRIHLGYHPDHATLAGGGTPVAVTFAPIQEWMAGAGIGVERPLGGRWTLGLGVDANRFSLDTAHRNGAVIDFGRNAFVNWNARIELARLFTWR
jgi:hypothetical protein